jgi:hypothetical protein
VGEQQDATAFGGPLVLDLFDLFTDTRVEGHRGARHAGVVGAPLEENLGGTLEGEEPGVQSITRFVFRGVGGLTCLWAQTRQRHYPARRQRDRWGWSFREPAS